VALTLSGTNNLGLAVTATTTTAANGTYSFSTDSNGNLLAPGTYKIIETPPANYTPVASNVGTVNGANDGTSTSSSAIGAITVISGQNGVNYNFGLVKSSGVSGYVYMDSDQTQAFNGPDDYGLYGQTVNLVGTDVLGHTVNLTATTDINGYYSFAGLLPGTYSVSVVAQGTIYSPDAANVGTVNGTSVGVANTTTDLEIDQVQLGSGVFGINYNFGFVLGSNPV